MTNYKATPYNLYMLVKTLRLATGLSQSKFSDLFSIPLATLQDWEHGRRVPRSYVIKMMKDILIYKNLFDEKKYQKACEDRKKDILYKIKEMNYEVGRNKELLKLIDTYIEGALTYKELDKALKNSLNYD